MDVGRLPLLWGVRDFVPNLARVGPLRRPGDCERGWKSRLGAQGRLRKDEEGDFARGALRRPGEVRQ